MAPGDYERLKQGAVEALEDHADVRERGRTKNIQALDERPNALQVF